MQAIEVGPGATIGMSAALAGMPVGWRGIVAAIAPHGFWLRAGQRSIRSTEALPVRSSPGW
jgi:hypothetical protein